MEDIPAQQNLEKESISVSLSCQATIYTATPCLPKSQEFIMTRYEERRSTEMPRSSGLNKSWWWVPDIIQVNTIKNEGIIFPKVYHFPRQTQIWMTPPQKKNLCNNTFFALRAGFIPSWRLQMNVFIMQLQYYDLRHTQGATHFTTLTHYQVIQSKDLP